ncbi:MAG: hypothetical protein ACRC5M_00690 [Anaeroplasmataceae bacterium]
MFNIKERYLEALHEYKSELILQFLTRMKLAEKEFERLENSEDFSVLMRKTEHISGYDEEYEQTRLVFDVEVGEWNYYEYVPGGGIDYVDYTEETLTKFHVFELERAVDEITEIVKVWQNYTK